MKIKDVIQEARSPEEFMSQLRGTAPNIKQVYQKYLKSPHYRPFRTSDDDTKEYQIWTDNFAQFLRKEFGHMPQDLAFEIGNHLYDYIKMRNREDPEGVAENDPDSSSSSFDTSIGNVKVGASSSGLTASVGSPPGVSASITAHPSNLKNPTVGLSAGNPNQGLSASVSAPANNLSNPSAMIQYKKTFEKKIAESDAFSYSAKKTRKGSIAEGSETNLIPYNLAAILKDQSHYGDGEDGEILSHAVFYLVKKLKYDRQKAVNLIYKTSLGDQIVHAYHELRRQGVSEGIFDKLKQRFLSKPTPMPKDGDIIRVIGREVKINYVPGGYIGFTWRDKNGEEHIEEVYRGDYRGLRSPGEELIKDIAAEIKHADNPGPMDPGVQAIIDRKRAEDPQLDDIMRRREEDEEKPNLATMRTSSTIHEQDVAEGKKPDRYHIVGKDGKPVNLASYPDRASAIKDRDEKYPGAVVQQVGPRGKVKGVAEQAQICSECGGPSYSNPMLAEKKDACYHKVKSRVKVWPSAYASGQLVQCRKRGASNWGTGGKKK